MVPSSSISWWTGPSDRDRRRSGSRCILHKGRCGRSGHTLWRRSPEEGHHQKSRIGTTACPGCCRRRLTSSPLLGDSFSLEALPGVFPGRKEGAYLHHHHHPSLLRSWSLQEDAMLAKPVLPSSRAGLCRGRTSELYVQITKPFLLPRETYPPYACAFDYRFDIKQVSIVTLIYTTDPPTHWLHTPSRK